MVLHGWYSLISLFYNNPVKNLGLRHYLSSLSPDKGDYGCSPVPVFWRLHSRVHFNRLFQSIGVLYSGWQWVNHAMRIDNEQGRGRRVEEGSAI